MDKPEKIKIGCCPFCGGNIKRANMKAFSRQSQIYGFNLALDGVDATWGALIYNFSAELELSAEQTAKLTTLGEEYDKMIALSGKPTLPAGRICRIRRCKGRGMQGTSERKLGLIMALTKFVNVYKCRLCGEMFTSSGTNSEIAAWKGTLHEIMKASGLDTPCSTPEVTPTMFEMHSCKNGSYGVADFQGTRKAADNDASL